MLKIVNKIYLQFHIVKKKEYKRLLLKLFTYLIDVDNMTVKYLYNIESTFRAYSSLSKARYVCIITGRGRSVYRKFCVSRMMVRYYGGHGFYNGLTKSSW